MDLPKLGDTIERSSEETFLCSICLEMFSEPVTTPCGHNFCRHCISQAWDTDGRCTCPLCKRSYSTRPELSVNTLLKEMVSQFKLEKEKSKSQVSKPGEVKCDLCSEPKLEALKSCLVCLSSFCEKHFEIRANLKTRLQLCFILFVQSAAEEEVSLDFLSFFPETKL
uniref:RING-type domain-containing protein n=1 Tax=Periophthalmus magnuspinnatus TaxID=409849 RepID=A0A3B4AY58_9GOBI